MGEIFATESCTSIEKRPTKADNYTRLNVSGICVNGNGVLVLDPHCECGSMTPVVKTSMTTYASGVIDERTVKLPAGRECGD